MIRRAQRVELTELELKLLLDLVSNDMLSRLNRNLLLPGEAHLLEKINRAYSKCAIIEPGGNRGHDPKEAAPAG